MSNFLINLQKFQSIDILKNKSMIIRIIKFVDNMINLLLMHIFSPELDLILCKSLFRLR